VAINLNRLLRYSALSLFTMLLFWLFFKYVLNWIAPFIIAFIISRLVEKSVCFLEKNLNFPRQFSSFICISVFFISLAFLTKIILFSGFERLRFFLVSLPETPQLAENLLSQTESILNTFFGDASPQIFSFVKKLVSDSAALSLHLRNKIISFTSSAALSVPDALLFFITLIISTFFFSSDYPKIRAFILKNLPARFILMLKDLRANISTTILRYVKALFILAGITWFELTAGFIILKVENAITTSFFIAILDALPLFGTGFVLIPWAIYLLLQGMHSRAIGISALYLSVTLIRNLLEPRIIGKQIGLHPLISLASVYIGIHIFGTYGLFFPLLITFLQHSLRPHKSAAAK